MHIHDAPYKRSLRHRRKKIRLPFGAQNLLAILEGVEGGFAIGAGLLAGLIFATQDRRLLLLTAGISLLVSGFNSSAVKYASEHYTDELDGREKAKPFKHYFVPAAYEFVTYAIVSFITIIPLLLIPDVRHATLACIGLTLVILFAAGWWRGHVMARRHRLRDGAEVLILGLLIILIGFLAGSGLHRL